MTYSHQLRINYFFSKSELSTNGERFRLDVLSNICPWKRLFRMLYAWLSWRRMVSFLDNLYGTFVSCNIA